MSMLEGVSQCWPLSQQCHVWWEAWSAFFAYLALCLGVVNVGVAAVAAAAVYWLGRQANALAGVAHRQASDDRERADRKAIARQEREESVVLCYLAAEISAASITIRVISMLLETDLMSESGFSSSEAARSFLLKKAEEVHIPLIETWVPRLHEIAADTGMRLARFAGDVQSLKLHLNRLNSPRTADGDADEGEAEESNEEYFKAGYAVVQLLAERAEKDIRLLNERAYVTGILLDSRMKSIS